jgi:hypothetical protein
VTKPHLDCVKAICPEFPDYRGKILFRFTIGSSDSNTLKFWEPSVPDFAERLESLKFAYEQGFQTSVSSEPILDDNIGDVIDRVSPFVTDSIWLGKMNHLRGRLALNGETDPVTMQKAEQLITWQSDENIKQLYSRYKNNPLVKWKDSVKKVLGLSISTEAMDLNLIAKTNPIILSDWFWSTFIGVVQLEESKLRGTKKDHILSTLEDVFWLISNALRPGTEIS